MAIAPLQLPDPIRTPSVDWSQLGKIGDALAGALRKQRISDVISAATGPDGALNIEGAAAQLAKNGCWMKRVPFAPSRSKRHTSRRAQPDMPKRRGTTEQWRRAPIERSNQNRS